MLMTKQRLEDIFNDVNDGWMGYAALIIFVISVGSVLLFYK